MGLFDDIWSTIKHTGEDIWNGAKDVVSNGYNDIFRPVSKGVGQAGNKLVNTGADFVDKQSNLDYWRYRGNYCFTKNSLGLVENKQKIKIKIYKKIVFPYNKTYIKNVFYYSL